MEELQIIPLCMNIKTVVDIVRVLKCDYIYLTGNGNFLGMDHETQMINSIMSPVGDLPCGLMYMAFDKFIPASTVFKSISPNTQYYLMNNNLLVPESMKDQFGSDRMYSDYCGVVVDNFTKEAVPNTPCVHVNDGIPRVNYNTFMMMSNAYNSINNDIKGMTQKEEFINAQNIPEVMNAVYGCKSDDGSFIIKFAGRDGRIWPVSMFKNMFSFNKSDKIDIYIYHDPIMISLGCINPNKYFIVQFVVHKKSPNVINSTFGRFINVFN